MIKAMFALSMILVLISGSSAFAQEVVPPERGDPPQDIPPPQDDFDLYDQTHPIYELIQGIEGDPEQRLAEKLEEMESLGIITTYPRMEEFEPHVLLDDDLLELDDQVLIESQFTMQDPVDIPYEKEGEPQGALDSELQSVNPVTGPIIIEESVAIDFGPPAVAYGRGYYMVVYEADGAIIGKVYNTAGDWQHTHTIVDHPNGSAYPSVAYEAQSGLFVVAYQFTYNQEGRQNIHVFAVSPTDGKLETGVPLAISSYDETRPSIACKHTNSTCLVAFQHSKESRIKGGFVSVSSSGITLEGTPRNLTAATGAYRPKLAWGMDSGYYMVTYNWIESLSPLKVHAMYNKVYDYPTGGQHIHTNEYVVPEHTYPYFTNRTLNPDVAYDPCTEKFVITFSYYYATDDYDIWAVAKSSTEVATGFPPFDVAISGDNERSPAISFVKGDHLTPSCGALDKLVVTYRNTDRGIMAADLRGNSSKTDPVYVRDSVLDQFVVASNTSFIDHWFPAISSGTKMSEMFIAYAPYYVNEGDHDIWGRIVEVMEYRTLTVSKEGTGAGDGVITSDPERINCGPVCEGVWPYKTTAFLNAGPLPGSTFTGWGGACSGMSLCILTMDSDKHVIAYYEEISDFEVFLPLIIR